MPRRRLLLHHHQTAYEPETLELPEEVVIPKKNAPSVNGTLRQTALRVPEVTWQCSGIMVFGKKIRSLVFSTDLAIIKNINADAVIAVYPFTPQPIINEALLMASDIPVFTGVGGGLTKGHRVVNLAMYAEMQGAMGVVVNVPTSGLVISRMRRTIDIPIVVTVANHGTDYARRIDDGAAIFNVAAGSATAEIVADIRAQFPDMPIMATGGPSDESILRTIDAGANAITYTPPSTADLVQLDALVGPRAEVRAVRLAVGHGIARELAAVAVAARIEEAAGVHREDAVVLLGGRADELAAGAECGAHLDRERRRVLAHGQYAAIASGSSPRGMRM